MLIDQKKTMEILREGGVVAVPTDTVYGLAGVFSCEKAIEEIYRLKKRPSDKPIGVLWDGKGDFAGEEEVGKDGVTYIVPAGDWVPIWVSRGSGMVGLRVPQHVGMLELIAAVGPVAAASANISGEKECITRDEVEEVFGKEFPVMEGACGSGRASQVLMWTQGGWKEMRKG